MPKVSGRNRHKVYERWNVTYPNEYANEVILEVIDRKNANGKKIHRHLKAEDSREEFLMPNARRNLHTPMLGNYNKRPAYYERFQHDSTARTTITTTISPNHMSSENEVVRPRKPGRGNPRQRTDYDRRLQWERQKERRLNRRRTVHKSTTTSTTTTTTPRTTPMTTTSSTTFRPANFEMRRQIIGEPPQIQTESYIQQQFDDGEDIDNKNKILQMYYLNKRKEEEQRELEEREYEKKKREKAEREDAERLEKEAQLKLEYEESVKRAQAEQEKLRERELQIKNRKDEENRRLLEQQENERLERERALEKEEELRRQQENLENARQLEQQERERLEREREMYEVQKRKAAEKIRQLEEEQRFREAEEAAAAEEEHQREQEIEERMKNTLTTEPAIETTTNSKKTNPMESQRAREANELAKKAEENKRRKYAERIMKLTPEQQKQWLAERKRRKLSKKNKLTQE